MGNLIGSEKSKVITNEELLLFIGKYAKIKCELVSKSKYRMLTIIIYDDYNNTNAVNCISTYIDKPSGIALIDNESYKITEISLTTEYELHIKLESISHTYIGNILSDIPFKIYKGYDKDLIQKSYPISN